MTGLSRWLDAARSRLSPARRAAPRAGGSAPAAVAPDPFEDVVTVALLALTALALILAATGASIPRLLVTLGFVLAAPGWAIVGYVGLPGRLTRLVAAMAVSVSICLLIATAMLSVGHWHPVPVMIALEAVTAVALAGRLLRTPGHGDGSGARR